MRRVSVLFDLQPKLAEKFARHAGDGPLAHAQHLYLGAMDPALFDRFHQLGDVPLIDGGVDKALRPDRSARRLLIVDGTVREVDDARCRPQRDVVLPPHPCDHTLRTVGEELAGGFLREALTSSPWIGGVGVARSPIEKQGRRAAGSLEFVGQHTGKPG